MWDWSKPSYNQYTSFFDDAVTILVEHPEVMAELAIKIKDFENKYKLTIAQAEIKVFMRLSGVTTKRMVIKEAPTITSVGGRHLETGRGDKEIRWLDMLEDLRLIRIWVQTQVKDVASELDFANFNS